MAATFGPDWVFVRFDQREPAWLLASYHAIAPARDVDDLPQADQPVGWIPACPACAPWVSRWPRMAVKPAIPLRQGLVGRHATRRDTGSPRRLRIIDLIPGLKIRTRRIRASLLRPAHKEHR